MPRVKKSKQMRQERMSHVRARRSFLKTAFPNQEERIRNRCGKCQKYLLKSNGELEESHQGSEKLIKHGLLLLRDSIGVDWSEDVNYCVKCYNFIVNDYPKQVGVSLDDDNFEEQLSKGRTPGVHVIVTKPGANSDSDSNPDGDNDESYAESESTDTEEPVTKRSNRFEARNIYLNRCILCSGGTSDQGITTDSESVVDADNLAAMFLLRKMLNIPEEKLQDFLPTLGQPKNWISSCRPCRNLILEAFRTQQVIQKLENDLLQFRHQFKTKIKSSWSKLESFGEEVVSMKSRCFVATNQWPDDPVKIENVHADETPPVPPPPPQRSVSMEVYDWKKYKTAKKTRAVSAVKITKVPTEPGSDAKTPQQILIVVPRKPNETRKFHAYHCKMCPFLDSMDLRPFVQHLLYHKKRPFKCTICGNFLSGCPLEFDSYPKRSADLCSTNEHVDHVCSLATIEKVPFETLPFWECHLCDDEFSTEEERDDHVRNCHINQDVKPVNAPYSCDVCDKQYSIMDDWQIHRVIEHPEIAEVSCYHCNQRFEITVTSGPSFLDATALVHHVKTSHKDERKDGEFRLLLECNFCGQNFSQAKHLEFHVETVHGISKAFNAVCPYCFVRKFDKFLYSLKKHVLQHHNEEKLRKFVCEFCGLRSQHRWNIAEHLLVVHSKIQENTKQLQKCKEEGCQFQTFMKRKIQLHMMKVHGAERRWKCSFCGKGFLDQGKLKDHEQLHSKKKPHQCEICGNSFALRNYLYIHMRLSHQNRPFASTNKKRPGKRKIAAASASTTTTMEDSALLPLPSESLGEEPLYTLMD